MLLIDIIDGPYVDGFVPDQVLGSEVSVPLVARNAQAPVRWEIDGGSLPAGWTFSGGLITGTADAPGAYSITVRLTDSTGTYSRTTLTWRVIAEPLSITGSLSTWAQLVPVNDTLTISGGSLSYVSVTVVAGALPDGITAVLAGSMIEFSGAASVAGPWSATMRVTDSMSASAEIALSGNVTASRLWTPADLSIVPAVWLDWDSAVTDVSGTASAWSNRGTAGGSMGQSEASRRPQILSSGINSLRALRFDGVDDRMQTTSMPFRQLFSSVGNGWCFVVVRRRATTGKTAAVWQSRTPSTTGRFACYAGADVVGYYNAPALVMRRLDADSAGVVRSATSTGSAWSITSFEAAWTAGIGRISVDGSPESWASMTSTGDTASTLSDAVYIGSEGGSTFADIDLACVLCSSGAQLLDADRQRLEGWAAYACGLQSLLPGDHPYRNYPPVVAL